MEWRCPRFSLLFGRICRDLEGDDALVCACRVVGWLVAIAIRNAVRANMFYISSSSDANARRSSAEVKVVISQPSFSLKKEVCDGRILRLITVIQEKMPGALTLFRGLWCGSGLLKLCAMLFAVSVSVMHDQCRKYNVTCTCTSGEREDRASLSIIDASPAPVNTSTKNESITHSTPL